VLGEEVNTFDVVARVAILAFMLMQVVQNHYQRLRVLRLEQRVRELEPKAHATMTLVVDLAMVEAQFLAQQQKPPERPS
jgi:hypothetical protein